MEEDAGSSLHCNNKLRSKLYSDDTEKVRELMCFSFGVSKSRMKMCWLLPAVTDQVSPKTASQEASLLATGVFQNTTKTQGKHFCDSVSVI